MKRILSLLTMTTVGFSMMVGCARITTQVVEKPRVDQELQGNQGYLHGTPSESATRKLTRQIVQADVELPTASELNPWRSKQLAQAAVPAAPVEASSFPVQPSFQESFTEPEEIPMPTPRQVEPEPELAPSSYTVKSGDTLEKIAAKVYGDSSRWRAIYKANQERLASPNKIYPGQKLIIPVRESRSQERSYSSDLK